MAIETLTQPIVDPIAAFDANNAQTITFNVIGGAQVVANKLVITNNKTGIVIYTQTVSNLKLAHTIPAGTLTNGVFYNAVIYTYDNSNNISVASTAIPFYCYNTPTLSITNIPTGSTIENNTFTFMGSYSQTEGEILNSYEFVLYDSNQDELSNSGLIYYASDSSFSYTFSGMANDTSYYIELKGITVNDTEVSSGLINFTVRYIQPASFAICDLTNNCENGYIQISSNLVAIDGTSNPEPPTYIDNKEVDLTDSGSWVNWSTGFNIKNDFTLGAWGRDFNNYENLITMTNELNSDDQPNKITLDWYNGDVIKEMPAYSTATGNNVNLQNSKSANIEDIHIEGNSEQTILPVEYQQVEYIESTGTQYIDTNYIPNSKTKIELKFRLKELYQNNYIFGAGDFPKYFMASLGLPSSSALYCYYDGHVNSSIGEITTTNYNIVTFDVPNQLGINFNNETGTTSQGSLPFENFPTYSIYLFGRHSAEGAMISGGMILWKTKIYEDNSLIHNFIPCYRKNDNVAGLYDTISNVFYTNQGTGDDFTVGESILNQNGIYSTGDIKNLINIDNFNITYTQQYYSSTNTNFSLKPGFIYTLSFDYKINSAQTDIYYSIGYGSTAYTTDIQSTIQYSTQSNGRNTITFTVPSTVTSSDTLWVKFGQTIILADINVDISNIQLEKGKIATDYQLPTKYNINLTSSKKNLFDYNNPNYVLANNVTYSTISAGYDIIPSGGTGVAHTLTLGFNNILNAGETYSFSYQTLGDLGSVELYTTDKDSSTAINKIAITNNSFTMPNGNVDLQMVITVTDGTVGYLNIWAMQIEKSNTPTDYEAFEANEEIISIDNSLKSINNHKDIIALNTINLINLNTLNAQVNGNTQYYFSSNVNKDFWTTDYSQFNNIGGSGTTNNYFALDTDGVYTLKLTAKNAVTGSSTTYLGFTENGGNNSGSAHWIWDESSSASAGDVFTLTSTSSENFVSMYAKNSTTYDWFMTNFDIELTKTYTVTLEFKNEAGNTISTQIISNGTFTTPNNCTYITFGSATLSQLNSNQCQIEIGNSFSQYLPYIESPTQINNIGEITFDGTEDWQYDTTNNYGYISISNANYYLKSEVVAKSNYFSGIDYNHLLTNDNVICISGKGNYICIKATGQFSTAATLKTWLAAKSTAGNPVKAIYVLATNDSELLSDSNISALENTKTYDSITNIYTNNTILGLNYVKYVSDYTSQLTQNSYVLLKCYNQNTIAYMIHSNYIDIPTSTEYVFIWCRRKNNLFDLKIENLGEGG